jgi:hypothetical protein
MAGIITHLSVLTMNVNFIVNEGLNFPIRRHHLTNGIKKGRYNNLYKRDILLTEINTGLG